MDERIFLQSIQRTSQSLGINTLLLLSGIEGLYTFRNVELNRINYQFLDSLILTIFALRIGDHFQVCCHKSDLRLAGLISAITLAGNVPYHPAPDL